jgi:hypothetical protein
MVKLGIILPDFPLAEPLVKRLVKPLVGAATFRCSRISQQQQKQVGSS